MHQPVRDNLEEYLRGVDRKFGQQIPAEMEAHLASCDECTGGLSELEQQALLLRALRAPEGLEPRAGFYARVMQRIEDARATNSVWSAFLEPIFAKRIIYATATLVVLLGTYLVSTEAGYTPTYEPTAIVAPATQVAATNSDDPSPQERDAVLVNLAAYQE